MNDKQKKQVQSQIISPESHSLDQQKITRESLEAHFRSFSLDLNAGKLESQVKVLNNKLFEKCNELLPTQKSVHQIEKTYN